MVKKLQINHSCIPDKEIRGFRLDRNSFLAYPTGISVNATGAENCRLT